MASKIYITIAFIFITHTVVAQENEKTEMADLMRSNGKIYVVIAVILTILAGLFIYLTRLDRKISRLEKDATA